MQKIIVLNTVQDTVTALKWGKPQKPNHLSSVMVLPCSLNTSISSFVRNISPVNNMRLQIDKWFHEYHLFKKESSPEEDGSTHTFESLGDKKDLQIMLDIYILSICRGLYEGI